MTCITLNLIPFASEQQCRTVRDSLVCLGYTVNVLRKSRVLNSCLNNTRGILVCLFDQHTTPMVEFLSFLVKNNHLPRFGIFFQDAGKLDDELLDHCNEFCVWPCQTQELAFRIERLDKQTRTSPWTSLDDKVVTELLDLNFIGRSPAFSTMVDRIRKFSWCDATVLIEGETGTGKENAARAIHYMGTRQSYPFIPVNCGALPDNLIENELFGHAEGAYTDARKAGEGLVAQAEGGSLFLDEVEALSNKGQVTLLRFLQDLEYRPLGGKKSIQSNVRVIAASNDSLTDLVKKGMFRRDLLFRLNIMPLNVPPLRERMGDIEVLSEYFLRSFRIKYDRPNTYIHPETLNWMIQYDWPGNIRELENYIHREFLLANGDEINMANQCNHDMANHISSQKMVDVSYTDLSFTTAKIRVVNQFEKSYLSRLMTASQGNITLAAKLAGKERRALGKLLKKHGIEKETFFQTN
jgi:DNA-binding NtrC family response regulator